MKRTFCIAAITLALDGASKGLAACLLGQDVLRLEGFLHLKLTRNTGMAFGIFSGSRWAGLILPLAVIACGCWVMRRYRPAPLPSAACGLVLGGFLGNFGQRAIWGYVLDMLYFPWLPWFVCNVADIAICLGAALLGISLLTRPQDWQERKEQPCSK